MTLATVKLTAWVSGTAAGDGGERTGEYIWPKDRSHRYSKSNIISTGKSLNAITTTTTLYSKHGHQSVDFSFCPGFKACHEFKSQSLVNPFLFSEMLPSNANDRNPEAQEQYFMMFKMEKQDQNELSVN